MRLIFLFLLGFLSLISINHAYAELSISDDSTGGDCTSIGTWNSATKTCTLTNDVTEQITILSNGITLDGNGYTLTVDQTFPNAGIYSVNIDDIIIKNFEMSVYGQPSISLRHGNDILITDNTIIARTDSNYNPGAGISVDGFSSSKSNNVIISNNVLTDLGSPFIYIMSQKDSSSGNKIFGNTITSPNYQTDSGFAGIKVLGKGTEIYKNIIDGVTYGIGPMGYNEIHNNLISNSKYAIDELNSQDNYNNIIYNNNFINNENISDESIFLRNLFYKELPVGGNHYDNAYQCFDNNFDNICDNDYKDRAEFAWNIPNGWLIQIITEGDITKEAQSQNGATISFSTSATNDGNPTSVSCNPSSNTLFSIGETEVVCTTPENRVTSFIVTVEDTTPPTITIPSNMELDANTGKGTIVDYGTVSVIDTVDSNVTVSCNPSSNTLFPIGENIVTCTSTDIHGNTAQKSFIVNIVTNIPLPIVNVPNNIVVDASAESGTYVEFPTITATDPSGLGLKGDPTCDHQSGDFFYDGTTIVTCTVENNKDFPGTSSFSITVNPFVPPPMVVDTFLPTNNELENGFSISDNQGDKSYTSGGAYIQGFEKTYFRSEGFSGSESIATTVWMVLEDTPFQTTEEIALDERNRKHENSKIQTQVGYKDFSPMFFPSECKGIEEDFTYQQKIQ